MLSQPSAVAAAADLNGGSETRSAAQPSQPGAVPPSPGRKLDKAKKDHICQLVANGHSFKSAAQMVGVSRRTLLRERGRDPLFGQRLRSHSEEIASLCFRSLRAAAADSPSAAMQLYKLVYPDRYYYRPNTINRKQHNKAFAELIKLFASIATPQQLQKLEQKLGPDGVLPR